MAIGAQVAYRDLAGFGRREMDVPPEELYADVLYQLAALDGIARATGGAGAYVKPHGALYNRSAATGSRPAAVIDAVADYDPALPVLALPGVGRARGGGGRARAAHRREAFADRAYTSAGALVPRREPGAVIHDVEEVCRPRRADGGRADGDLRRRPAGSGAGAARSACTATPRTR